MADNASRIDTDREAQGHDVMGDEFIPGDTISEDTAPETGASLADAPVEAKKRRWRKPLLLIAPVILIVGALAFYLHGGRYESTDNAYLQSGLVAVSPNVEGRVVSIEVRNNQQVKKGDILFRLDPAPYRAAVAEAQAQLAAAKTEVGSLRANYAQGSSELAAAQTRVRFAEREAARQKELVAEGISRPGAIRSGATRRADRSSGDPDHHAAERKRAGATDRPTSTRRSANSQASSARRPRSTARN